MISILISTRNRPDQLKTCLQSILLNDYLDYEILLVDQSTGLESTFVVRKLNRFSSKIRYWKSNKKGKAGALNFMIRKAKGEILAFTDDDCIVSKNWLEEVNKLYTTFPKIAGGFGNTFAWQPHLHENKYCPALFREEKTIMYSDPAMLNWYNFGQGNNMTLRKSVVLKLGTFRSWLGVGTVGQAGEESELVFRILVNGFSLVAYPSMVVFHDKWLRRSQEAALQSRYTSGLLAFSSSYLLTKHTKIASKYISSHLSGRLPFFSRQISHFFYLTLLYIVFLLFELRGIVQGIVVGFFYGLMESSRSK